MSAERNLKDGSVKTCPINKDVQDPVSAFYFFRTVPLSFFTAIMETDCPVPKGGSMIQVSKFH